MNSKLFAILIASLSGASCSDQAGLQALDHGWAPAGACEFVGNDPNKHYCATTGTQLLANPTIYNGRLVRISAWVVAHPDGEGATMFLSREALEAGAGIGTVSLRGPAVERIAASAKGLDQLPAQVSGRFRLYGLDAKGNKIRHGSDSFRFGAIEEVTEW